MLPQNAQPDNMKVMSACPVCNVSYNPMQARVIDEADDARLIFIQCEKCSSSVVAVVMHGGLGVTSVGLITDLHAEEVLKYKDASPISEDDVLEIHSFLSEDPHLYSYFTGEERAGDTK